MASFDIQKGYCCEEMQEVVQKAAGAEGASVAYIPKFRRFVVMDCPAYTHSNEDQRLGRPISYCPWCGAQLPSALGDVYYEVLRAEFPAIARRGTAQHAQLPEEFESDEWWKKRGL